MLSLSTLLGHILGRTGEMGDLISSSLLSAKPKEAFVVQSDAHLDFKTDDFAAVRSRAHRQRREYAARLLGDRNITRYASVEPDDVYVFKKLFG